jgi:hypothetical protein
MANARHMERRKLATQWSAVLCIIRLFAVADFNRTPFQRVLTQVHRNVVFINVRNDSISTSRAGLMLHAADIRFKEALTIYG